MTRYIDADVLKRNIRINLMPNVDVDGTVTVENAERYFLNLIDKTSTADVVEVVRCENCKRAKPMIFSGLYNCRRHRACRTKDDFCSYGKRK